MPSVSKRIQKVAGKAAARKAPATKPAGKRALGKKVVATKSVPGAAVPAKKRAGRTGAKKSPVGIVSEKVNLDKIPSIGHFLETKTPDGRGTYSTGVGGTVFTSELYGRVTLSQAIMRKWHSASVKSGKTPSGETIQKYLGLPMRNSQKLRDGVEVAYFERGVIVIRGSKAHVVYGMTYMKYASLGGVRSSFGLPTSDVVSAAKGGTVCSFDGCDIYWHPSTAAFEVHGAIRDKYKALGGCASWLGYPLSDECKVLSKEREIGRFSCFQGASIYWSSGTGAWEVHGAIRDAWLKDYGGPAGSLGFPTSDERDSPRKAGRYNNFRNGVLFWRRQDRMIHKLTKVALYVTRFDSRGSDTVTKNAQDLYVKHRLSTSTGQQFSQRFPSSGDYGPSKRMNSVIREFPLRQGDFTMDVVFEGWDSDNTSADDHLGTVSAKLTIDTLFEPEASASEWHRDFRVHFTGRTDAGRHVKNVRKELFWSFGNPGKDKLPWDYYAQTFRDVHHDESVIWHPFNKLFYEVFYKGSGKAGRCFGMCLEAVYARLDRSRSSQPIAIYNDGLKENSIRFNDIWVKHGYQFGGEQILSFIGSFLTGATRDPVRVFHESRAAYARGDYPLISMGNDAIYSKGHAVMPYRWDDSNPNKWIIYIANPTYPKLGDTHPSNMIEIHNPRSSNPSYTYLHGSEVWTGSKKSGGRMLSIPFHLLASEPRTPFNEIAKLIGAVGFIILADGGRSESITSDKSGPLHSSVGVLSKGVITAQARDYLGAATAQLQGQGVPGLVPIPVYAAMKKAGRAGAVLANHKFETVATGLAKEAFQLDFRVVDFLRRHAEFYALDEATFRRKGAKQLRHLVGSSGSYRWGYSSGAFEAALRVEDSKSSDTIAINPGVGGAADVLSFVAGSSGGERKLTAELGASTGPDGSGSPVYRLTNLRLDSARQFHASVSEGGQTVTVQSLGEPIELELEAFAANTAQPVRKTKLEVAAGQTMALKAESWRQGTRLEVRTLDKFAGKVLSSTSI